MGKSERNLTSLEELLPGVARRLGIESRIKELMVMNYWPEIAKGTIGKDSKPYSIKRTKKGLVLNVAAKSAMVVQELSMVKMQLLDRINDLSLQVGIKIADISVSTKYWVKIPENISEKLSKERNEIIKGENVDLDSISLNQSQKDSIEQSLAELNLQDDVRERLKQVLIRDFKLKIYKEKKGYPVCKQCGVFLGNFYQEYCPVCKFK